MGGTNSCRSGGCNNTGAGSGGGAKTAPDKSSVGGKLLPLRSEEFGVRVSIVCERCNPWPFTSPAFAAALSPRAHALFSAFAASDATSRLPATFSSNLSSCSAKPDCFKPFATSLPRICLSVSCNLRGVSSMAAFSLVVEASPFSGSAVSVQAGRKPSPLQVVWCTRVCCRDRNQSWANPTTMSVTTTPARKKATYQPETSPDDISHWQAALPLAKPGRRW
mmetsp:Transcript_63623/g.160587  ORF Transcript_63623/g.160587 Transcript_63623/m.160587 type:complete len:221 (+) Transcript_63623:1116-1778(+)